MKKHITYTLFLISTLFDACTIHREQQPVSVSVTALVDITDHRAVVPNAESILSLYDFPNDKNKEAFFRIAFTTDKLLNHANEFHLEATEATENDNQYDDPDFRDKEVLTFYATVRQALINFNTQNSNDTPLHHSECFRSIANELTLMKQRKTTKCILAVYSDLAEYSDIWNVYAPTSLQQLTERSDAIVKLFEATGLLPAELSGCTILFIYQPTSREDDKQFHSMSEVFKKLLIAHGATVLISADNPTYIQL